MDTTETISIQTLSRITGLERARAHLSDAANSLREALAGLSREDEDLREAITTLQHELNEPNTEIYDRLLMLWHGDEPEPVIRRPIPEGEARYLARDSIDIIEGAMCAFNAAVSHCPGVDPQQFDDEWFEAWWTLYGAVPEIRTEVLEALQDSDPNPDDS